MHNGLSSLFSDDGTNLRAKVIGIYLLLIGANVAAWLWALIAFHNYPIRLELRRSPIRSVYTTRSTPIISRRSTM